MSGADASTSQSYHREDFSSPPRTGTDSSHYSCSNLKDDDPARYIRASEARRQVLEAPDKRPRLPAETSKRGKLASYPETFKNREKLPLQAQSPWKEYPVMPSGSWDPATGKHGVKATRAIYNNGDRGTFDVIYHDPTISDRHDENFSVAAYRSARK